MNRYNYVHKDVNSEEIDKIVSKQIMNYLKDFFLKKKHKTLKKRKSKINKTIKNYN